MFGPLDFIYVPATDVDADAQRHVDTLGARLVWKIRGMGTTVACLHVGEPGPAILLSGHLHGTSPILVTTPTTSTDEGAGAARSDVPGT